MAASLLLRVMAAAGYQQCEIWVVHPVIFWAVYKPFWWVSWVVCTSLSFGPWCLLLWWERSYECFGIQEFSIVLQNKEKGTVAVSRVWGGVRRHSTRDKKSSKGTTRIQQSASCKVQKKWKPAIRAGDTRGGGDEGRKRGTGERTGESGVFVMMEDTKESNSI
jgi:hypothetical protein